MGFAAKKSKSVELTLTTEIGQDGMLFITNLLLKISILAITLILNISADSPISPLMSKMPLTHDRKKSDSFPLIYTNIISKISFQIPKLNIIIS